MLKARPSSVNFRAHRAPWREHLQQTKIARSGAVRQSSAPSLNLCLFHMCFCLNLSCIPLIADTFYMPFLSVDRPKTGTARAVHATLYPGLSLVRCQARKHIPEHCISVLFHSKRVRYNKTKSRICHECASLAASVSGCRDRTLFIAHTPLCRQEGFLFIVVLRHAVRKFDLRHAQRSASNCQGRNTWPRKRC